MLGAGRITTAPDELAGNMAWRAPAGRCADMSLPAQHRTRTTSVDHVDRMALLLYINKNNLRRVENATCLTGCTITPQRSKHNCYCCCTSCYCCSSLSSVIGGSHPHQLPIAADTHLLNNCVALDGLQVGNEAHLQQTTNQTDNDQYLQTTTKPSKCMHW